MKTEEHKKFSGNDFMTREETEKYLEGKRFETKGGFIVVDGIKLQPYKNEGYTVINPKAAKGIKCNIKPCGSD